MAKDIRVSLELDNRKFKRDLDASKKQVETFGATGLKTASIFRVLAGAFAVREVIQFSDTITNLKNKLLTLEPSAAVVQQQFDRIRQIAFDSRSDLEGVGDLYFRIARAQESLGITSEETATIVESVSKAITASGLSSAEARGPLLQLGQALQSGRFQGDELRSILEGLPDVARALARSLGVPIGKLKELGSQGLITGDVFVDAMRKAKASIDEAFANTEITIGQGLSLLTTAFAGLIDTISTETGIFTGLAESLRTIAEGVETLASSTDAIKSFGTALLSLGAASLILRASSKDALTGFVQLADYMKSFFSAGIIGTFVARFKDLGFALTLFKGGITRISLGGFITALGGLTAAALPIAGIFVGIATAIYGIRRALQGIRDLEDIDIVKKISRQGKEATIKAIQEIRLEIEKLKESQDDLTGSFLLDIRNIRASNKEIERLEKRIELLYKQIDKGVVGPPLPPDIEAARRVAKDTEKAILDLMLSIKGQERTPEKFRESLAKLNELFADRKTNEQILEYEKNLKELYRTFGEELPKENLFKEINDEIAKVNDFETYNAVLEKISEGFRTGNLEYEDRIALMENLRDSLSDAEISMESFKNAVSDIDVQISDNLVDSIFEGTNAIDALKSTFKNAVKQMLADAIRLLFIQKIIGGIFGAFGYNVDFLPGGGIGDITKRAQGGPVMPNKPYLVGEQGPEILVPGTSGTIIPNHAMGGVQNVYYNIQATDAASFQALLSRDRQFVHALVTKANRDLPSGRRF